MAINKRKILVSEIISDLNNGMTWLESENVGFGSIQTKYGANEQQIGQFRKHPKLINAEPNITIFQIVDDLEDFSSEKTLELDMSQTQTLSTSESMNEIEAFENL